MCQRRCVERATRLVARADVQHAQTAEPPLTSGTVGRLPQASFFAACAASHLACSDLKSGTVRASLERLPSGLLLLLLGSRLAPRGAAAAPLPSRPSAAPAVEAAADDVVLLPPPELSME